MDTVENIHPITETAPTSPSLALVKRSPFDQLRELATYLADLDTVANALCKATILPPTLQTPANMKLALLQGMSMGFDVVQVTRASFVIESKKGGARVGYYVEALVALVRSSPVCRFFRVEEATAERCRVTCARKDEPESVVHTFELTMKQAQEARLDCEWEWNPETKRHEPKQKYTWKTAPADMLRNRTCGRSVKSVFQDVVYGMATPDELDDIAAAEVMDREASGGFVAIPNASPRAAAGSSSSPPPGTNSAAAAPPATSDIVDAELVPDEADTGEGTGDPAWDSFVHELAQVTSDRELLGAFPVMVQAAWDKMLGAVADKKSLNALAPWIGAANKRAGQSKACAAIAAHMQKSFNAKNAEIRDAERAAKKDGGK